MRAGNADDSGPLRIRFAPKLGQSFGLCRATPVNLGPGQPTVFLGAFCADFDVDRYPEIFLYPTDTMKLALFAADGRLVGTVGGAVALAGKLTGHGGDQLLSYHVDDHLRLWINPSPPSNHAPQR